MKFTWHSFIQANIKTGHQWPNLLQFNTDMNRCPHSRTRVLWLMQWLRSEKYVLVTVLYLFHKGEKFRQDFLLLILTGMELLATLPLTFVFLGLSYSVNFSFLMNVLHTKLIFTCKFQWPCIVCFISLFSRKRKLITFHSNRKNC